MVAFSICPFKEIEVFGLREFQEMAAIVDAPKGNFIKAPSKSYASD